MRCAKGIKFAFAPLGKAGKPPTLPQGANAIPPPCQDFMGIALVPNIPHQLVLRGVEDIVDGGCQFDNAQPRAQMPARH